MLWISKQDSEPVNYPGYDTTVAKVPDVIKLSPVCKSPARQK